MKSAILALIFLASCFSVGEQLFVQGPSPKKQKQKIAVLQKKLESAEKEEEKIHSDVEKLQLAINDAQIALIRRQIDDCEKRGVKSETLFMEEREALYKMIESGPSPSAFDAQVELDRILRIITASSDEEKYVY